MKSINNLFKRLCFGFGIGVSVSFAVSSDFYGFNEKLFYAMCVLWMIVVGELFNELLKSEKE